MDHILAAILPQLIMSAVTGIAGWAIGKMRGVAQERDRKEKQRVKERDDARAIDRLLLGYRLQDIHREFVVGGKPCSAAEKHEAEEVYQLYHGLGGNGAGTRMYQEIMALHVE